MHLYLFRCFKLIHTVIYLCNIQMSMNVKNVRGNATITLTAPTPWALITADVRKVSAGMELHALRVSDH